MIVNETRSAHAPHTRGYFYVQLIGFLSCDNKLRAIDELAGTVLDKNSSRLLRRAARILARRTKPARMGESSPSVLRIELLLYSSLVSRSGSGNRTKAGTGWKAKGEGRNRRPAVGHVNWTDDAAKSRVPRKAERPRVKNRRRRFVRN